MAEQYENHLPHNWIKMIKCKGGTLEEVYVNLKTEMIFFTKEEYQQFIREIIQIGPQVIGLPMENFRFHGLQPKSPKSGRPDGASTSGSKMT